MYGFWDKTNPASTDKQDVKLTSTSNGGKLLAVVFNKEQSPWSSISASTPNSATPRRARP